ncbi:AAA family ATPase [Cupriavidus gilardii]|uniref:AAA family ATPase n=1 Tax=Cupriavidus gilardii TaxID=82541 RepID=UPI0007E3BF50|nr:AAA family ATPase [Cupriavidus gilardii]
MLTILIASEQTDRLSEITRLCTQCGSFQSLALAEAPARIASHASQLALADMLVIAHGSMGPAQMQGIEAMRQQHPELPCILITDAVDPDLLIKALRSGIRDVLAWPLEQGQLGDALRRLQAAGTQRRRRAARLISLLSCKGGAGVTFLTANLGHALAAQGKRVLVLDLNRQFGDLVHTICDRTPPATLPDVCAQIDRMDAAFLEACLTPVADGLDVLAGAADPIKAASVRKEQVEWILSLALPHYDFVLVDAGQAIDPVSIGVLDRSDRIGVVLQPTIAYARTGRRLLDILRALRYPDDRIRVLLNRDDRRNELDRTSLEQICGTPVWQALPEDAATVAAAISHGEAVLAMHRRSAIARALQSLAAQLAAAEPEAQAGGSEPSSLRRLLLRVKAA